MCSCPVGSGPLCREGEGGEEEEGEGRRRGRGGGGGGGGEEEGWSVCEGTIHAV